MPTYYIELIKNDVSINIFKVKAWTYVRAENKLLDKEINIMFAKFSNESFKLRRVSKDMYLNIMHLKLKGIVRDKKNSSNILSLENFKINHYKFSKTRLENTLYDCTTIDLENMLSKLQTYYIYFAGSLYHKENDWNATYARLALLLANTLTALPNKLINTHLDSEIVYKESLVYSLVYVTKELYMINEVLVREGLFENSLELESIFLYMDKYFSLLDLTYEELFEDSSQEHVQV